MLYCLAHLRKLSQTLLRHLNWGSTCFLITFSSACEGSPFYDIHYVRSAIASYNESMELVDLGDSKNKFIELIYSSQQNLPKEYTRPPTKYYKDNYKVEVYFVRSGLVSLGRVSSDDVTPYLFVDEILVAIGWPAIDEYEK